MKRPVLLSLFLALAVSTLYAQNSQPPIITSLSPDQGSPANDVVNVGIEGSNLSGVTAGSFRFTLGGVSTTAITVSDVQVATDGDLVSADLDVCGALPGAYELSLVTAGGQSNSEPFTVTASGPVISNIAPRSGSPGTSFPMTISGCALENAFEVNTGIPGVSFSNISSTPTQVDATMTIAASQPQGLIGVAVDTPSGTSNTAQFLVVVGPQPSLSSLAPSSQPPGSSFVLTLNGSNLADTTAVTVSPSTGFTLSDITSTASQITAQAQIASTASTGSYVISATTTAGQSNGLTFTVSDTFGPTITNISPANVTAGSGAFTLTVNGSTFVSGSTVRVNGSNRSTTFINNAEVRAEILAGDIASAGSESITVENPPQGNTGATVSNSVTLTVSSGGSN